MPAQRVQVLDAGVLKGLLMSRVPSKDVASSNGHGRSGGFGEPCVHVGTLVVSAKGGLSRAALLSKAQQLAKRQKEPVYVVRLLDDGITLGGSGGDMSSMMRRFMGQGGPVSQRPLVAYRVESGKETPVRGFTLEGLRLQSLKDLAAAGKEPTVLNFFDLFAGGIRPTGFAH